MVEDKQSVHVQSVKNKAMIVTTFKNTKKNVEVGMHWREAFGSWGAPGVYRTRLKNYEARIQRLAANKYTRINEKTSDQRKLQWELENMNLLVFLSQVKVNQKGIIIELPVFKKSR